MDICGTIAKRSTCVRLQTSAILVKNNNIISIGYNGSCSGSKHCYDHWYEHWSKNKDELKNNDECDSFDNFIRSDEFYKKHHDWANKYELHGECNAIINAARNNTSSEGAIMYTIYAPCTQCSKIIISSKISMVYYKHLYKRDTYGIDFLKKNNIECIQLKEN